MSNTIPKIDTNALRENLQKFNQQVKDKANRYKKKEKDNRLYNSYISMTADYYGSIIRFLPPAEGDSLFFAQAFQHKHRINSKRFMLDECIRSIDDTQPCAACDASVPMWKTWSKETQKLMRRKIWYVSNILVVTDPQHPELEGKVMLFRYSKEVFEKIMSKFSPSNVIDKPCDIFYYINGRNFKLKITKDADFWSYKTSEFDDVSPLFGGDATLINTAHQQIYSLGKYMEEVKNSINYATVKASFDFMFKPMDEGEGEEAELPFGDTHMSVADSKPQRIVPQPSPTTTSSAPVTAQSSVEPKQVLRVESPVAVPTTQTSSTEDDDFFKDL